MVLLVPLLFTLPPCFVNIVCFARGSLRKWLQTHEGVTLLLCTFTVFYDTMQCNYVLIAMLCCYWRFTGSLHPHIDVSSLGVFVLLEQSSFKYLVQLSISIQFKYPVYINCLFNLIILFQFSIQFIILFQLSTVPVCIGEPFLTYISPKDLKKRAESLIIVFMASRAVL